MFKFKSIIMGIAASAIMAASSLSGVVSADYDAHYDIDKDGYVTSTDIVLMNKFLYGVWAPSNVSDLDANQNGVVDWIDQDMITACVLGVSKTINTH